MSAFQLPTKLTASAFQAAKPTSSAFHKPTPAYQPKHSSAFSPATGIKESAQPLPRNVLGGVGNLPIHHIAPGAQQNKNAMAGRPARLIGKVHSRCFSCQGKMVTGRGQNACQLCNGRVGDGDIREVRTVTFCPTCMKSQNIWNALVVGMEALSPGSSGGVDRYHENGVKIYACQQNSGCWNRLRREKLLNALRTPPPERPSSQKARRSHKLSKAGLTAAGSPMLVEISPAAAEGGRKRISKKKKSKVVPMQFNDDDVFALLSLRTAAHPSSSSEDGDSCSQGDDGSNKSNPESIPKEDAENRTP